MHRPAGLGDLTASSWGQPQSFFLPFCPPPKTAVCFSWGLDKSDVVCENSKQWAPGLPGRWALPLCPQGWERSRAWGGRGCDKAGPHPEDDLFYRLHCSHTKQQLRAPNSVVCWLYRARAVRSISGRGDWGHTELEMRGPYLWWKHLTCPVPPHRSLWPQQQSVTCSGLWGSSDVHTVSQPSPHEKLSPIFLQWSFTDRLLSHNSLSVPRNIS